MNYYFIDKEIYFQGVKQPPRKIQCFNIRYKGNMATFRDEDGNDYVVADYEILPENKIDEALYKEMTQFELDNIVGV